MSAKFRNSTALVAAFSLVIPSVAPAQQVVDQCEAGSVGISAEAASDLDLTLSDAQKAALAGEAAGDAVIVSTVDGTPTLCMPMADLEAMGVTEAEVKGVVEAQASENEEKGLLESAVDAVTGDDEVPQAEAEAEPEGGAQAEAETEVETETEADAAGGAQAEAETDAQAEAGGEEKGVLEEALDAVTGTDEPSAAEAETKPEATAEAEADAAAEPEVAAEDAATAEADGAPEAEAETAAEGETTAEAETAPETEADATTQAEMEATPEPSPEMKAAAEAIEAQSVEETDPEAQAQMAESEAPEASAAAEEDAQAAEVEEETVTEDTARSSSEEFSEKVSGAAKDAAKAESGKKGGMSDLEKALLVGLGAVVVGKALQGNDKAQVVTKSNDRVVVLEDGRYRVIRDDNELIERPGTKVRRETFNDGSTRTTVTRENGVQIVTIRDPELRVLRRTRIDADGNRTVLIDDTADVEPVDVAELPAPAKEADVGAATDADTLRQILSTKSQAKRTFALYQVRNIERVRKLAPAIDLDAINFRTASAVIDPQEAEELSALGNLIRSYIEENPREVFLVEGHTDAVGNAAYNLALSDRRAESVALALTEYFDVPPENLVVQGYGESDLKVKTLDAERANRRAAVRRITPLLSSGT